MLLPSPFNEGERLLLIRSFSSPTCLRCHSISYFGRHLGVDDKYLDIMLPSVGGMVTSPCSAENRLISSGVRNCDTYICLGH